MVATSPQDDTATPAVNLNQPASQSQSSNGSKNAGDILIKRAKRAVNRGETGDAELLGRLYSKAIRYDHAEKQWYLWKGHNWKPDRTGFVYRLVSNYLAAYFMRAAAEDKKRGGDGKAFLARSSELHIRRRVESVLHFAARLPTIALTGDEWDADPWLLGVENGVIDLRTGDFRPGLPSDYIKSVCETTWEGWQAQAIQFENFLQEVFGFDKDLVQYVQRLFGYGLTGLSHEPVLPIFHGGGRNGKSTLLEVLGDVLGPEIATSSQADALMDTGRSIGNAAQPFVYDLRGKRLVWAVESNEERTLNAGLVKKLTGGDRIKCRTLNARPVEFYPTHLIVLVTNNQPKIPDDGQAIWDRIALIPFEKRFVDSPLPGEYQRDSMLREKLKLEAPGILAWLVRGCLEWQRQGMNPPAVVKAATQNYKAEQDLIQPFIDERCVLGPLYDVKAGDLYTDYKNWAIGSGETPLSMTMFGNRMKKRFKTFKSSVIFYSGIGLVNPTSTQKGP